jgi:hypothetical protein
MKLIFFGDLCISGDACPSINQPLKNFLADANFVCANFEGPIAHSEILPSLKAGPLVRQSDSVLTFIKQSCITHLNLANNHIMDFGVSGLKRTLEKLKGLQLVGAGLSIESAYKPNIIEYDGQKVALLAFAEAQFGVMRETTDYAGFAWIDSPEARRAVLKARNEADWLIVQVHAGLEMVDLPLPEWRERYRELIDLGADIVIGHHPHVVQGVENYKGRQIHYSLGNFYMDVMLNQDDPGSGALLEVNIRNGLLTAKAIPLVVSLETIDIDMSLNTKRLYENLSEKLIRDSYLDDINSICEQSWSNIYSEYYESALTGLGAKPTCSSVYKFFKKILWTLLRIKKSEQINNLMLLHNIRIESHRWVVERALSKKLFK